MSFTLEGTINGMRPVDGRVEQGKNAGSFWHFLSMEVCDPRYGQVYSCQVRTSEKELFAKFVKLGPGKDKENKAVEVGSLVQDLTGHNVKLLVKGVSAGERKITDKESGADDIVLQVRFYVAGLKDLGLPKDDDF